MSWSCLKPTNLHVAHFWGGGTEGWIEDFAAADSFSENLVLQSLGTYECYGIRHRLVHPTSGEVLGSWVLQHPITEARSTHDEYANRLKAICDDYRIEHIYVSSLIGHTFDVFRLGIQTTKIYHDYFPYCPAFFITRDGICTSCSEEDLGKCKSWNTSHRPKGSPGYYPRLRDAYFDAVISAGATHVSPSRSLPRNLRRLDQRFEAIDFDIVEHGITQSAKDLFGGAEDGRRLRVGVLGLLGWNKGREVIRRHFDIMRTIADIHIIGAEEAGVEYSGRWGARFVPNYTRSELAAVLERHRLDQLIFLSLVPETFSYTLSEAWCFCIPPAARKIGAHGERIDDGVDGFLFGLEDDAVIDFLLWADRERGQLRRVARRLREKPVRRVEEAVCDYYRLRHDYPDSLERTLAQVS